MQSDELAARSAPERIWTADTHTRCSVGFDTPSPGYKNPYILATEAALAASPEVQALIRDAEARGYARGWRAGMQTAESHVAEARNGHEPGPLFRALNEALGKIQDARFAALRGEKEPK